MEDIFSKYPQIKLRDVTLPGTHDSGSYGISIESPPTPGLNSFFLSSFKNLAVRWGVTQERTIYKQLSGGIRELDFRIAYYNEDFYLEYGLISVKLEETLQEISDFISENPKEAIFLEYFKLPQDTSSYPLLKDLTLKYLSNNLIPPVSSNESLSFKKIWENPGQNIILTVKSSSFKTNHQNFWDWSKVMTGVYANTTDLSVLENSLINGRQNYPGLMNQEKSKFHYASITSTGSVYYMIKDFLNYLFFGLKNETLKSLSRPLFQQIGKWIQKWRKKKIKMNIITADFYHLTDLVKESIENNRELTNKKLHCLK